MSQETVTNGVLSTPTAHSEDIEAVLGRLERLEKENRWLKRGGVAILLLSVFASACEPVKSLAVPSQTGTSQEKIVAKEIEAERFLVKDASGNRRAFLGVALDSSDKCLLVLDAGHFRAAMSADKRESTFLMGSRASNRIFMRTVEEGSGLAFSSAVLSSRGPAPPAGVAASESGRGPAQSEAVALDVQVDASTTGREFGRTEDVDLLVADGQRLQGVRMGRFPLLPSSGPLRWVECTGELGNRENASASVLANLLLTNAAQEAEVILGGRLRVAALAKLAYLAVIVER
jgi:hypothetical protein